MIGAVRRRAIGSHGEPSGARSVGGGGRFYTNAQLRAGEVGITEISLRAEQVAAANRWRCGSTAPLTRLKRNSPLRNGASKRVRRI